jgi:hypothetical protein
MTRSGADWPWTVPSDGTPHAREATHRPGNRRGGWVLRDDRRRGAPVPPSPPKMTFLDAESGGQLGPASGARLPTPPTGRSWSTTTAPPPPNSPGDSQPRNSGSGPSPCDARAGEAPGRLKSCAFERRKCDTCERVQCGKGQPGRAGHSLTRLPVPGAVGPRSGANEPLGSRVPEKLEGWCGVSTGSGELPGEGSITGLVAGSLEEMMRAADRLPMGAGPAVRSVTGRSGGPVLARAADSLYSERGFFHEHPVPQPP